MLCILEFQYFDFTIKLTALAFIWYKKSKILKPDDQDMSIFLYNVALGYSCLLFYTALRFSSYLNVGNSEIRYFYFTIKLASLPFIWYKKIRIPKLDDQDMSIFLYSVALGCSCLLSNTALRFPLYLKLYISEFRYFYFTINLASLPLIRYPMTRIWAFFCTVFFIVPYSFLRISRSASPNSNIFISE